jgi:DNA primase
MIKFSEAFLENLKSRADIADIISRHVPLQKKGREYVACCPFHQEKTPSFTVNSEKGFYHCFGCGAHGSVFDFIMQRENANFPEAVEKVADYLGVPVPRQELTIQEKETLSLQDELLKIHEAATVFFEQKLQTSLGQQARDYLKKRGVLDRIQKKFRLGFSVLEKDALYKYLNQAKFSAVAIQASGLIIFPDDKTKQPYDKFRGRLMFPIFNEKNHVIAFGGRILDAGEPKYLNSPETPIFKKGFELYNLNLAKDSKSKKEPWIIVEGYMDAIALFQAGYETVVAPLGTALTEHHITKIWRFCETPILCFDGDKAGKSASIRAARRALPFLKPGCSLSFSFLPEGQDPDSFVVSKGLDALKQLLESHTVPLVDVLWTYITNQGAFKTPEEKAMVKNRILEVVADIQDAAIKGFYRRDLDNKFFQSQRSSFSQKQAPLKDAKLWQTKSDAFLKEKVLLAILVTYPALLEKFEESLVFIEFKDLTLGALKKSLLDYYYGENPLEKSSLNAYLTQHGDSKALARVFENSVRVHIPSLENGSIQDVIHDCAYVIDFLKKHQSLSGDLEEAKESLKETFSEESWKRFQELKKSFNKNE